MRQRPSELRIRREDVEWADVDGAIVVMDLRTSGFVKLNRTASRLWQSLVEGASGDRLAATLVEDFGIDEAAAVRDAQAFVDELRERDLLASA